MTIDECVALAEAHLCRALGGQDKSDFESCMFDPDEFRRECAQVGIGLPETWLRVLPYFIDALPCYFDPDLHCEISSPKLLVKNHQRRLAHGAVKDKWDEMRSNRWLEFGSNCSEVFYAFDLQSADMPRDARVVRWNIESAKQDETWETVIDFVAKMLGPLRASR